jgi:hypothetical protein
MNEQLTPLKVYQKNIEEYSNQASVIKGKRSVIGWARLGIAALTFAAVKLIWNQELWVIIAVAIAGIACFLYVVSLDVNLKEKLQNLERLVDINAGEINVLKNEFLGREDGKRFETPNHPYAQDMDVFGTASLYQYISRCTAEQSKQLLADKLLQPGSKQVILPMQEAVKELTTNTGWRQQLQAFGLATPINLYTETRIKNWLVKPAAYNHPFWLWLARLYPFITLGCLALNIFNLINAPVFTLLVFAFFVFSIGISKGIHPTWLLLSKIVPEVDTLYKQLNHIESGQFNSAFIAAIKKSIQSNVGIAASKEIRELKAILNRFDVRLNVFAFNIVNTFFLWDLWQMLALNAWKKKNATAVQFWFKAIADAEVAASIATLAFNQPGWCYPEITEEHFTLSATTLGHPLIAAGKRVNNSFGMQGQGKVSIITGSNMGGKSTFLRSLGVNIILALMGAPACAEAFTVSPVLLMSSMRIADNLAESTSTFYAELKKLKSIIGAVNSNEKIFILLDEILRGTNSLDRHTGSKALIQQFIHHNAVAVTATHDVELAKLISDFPEAISNYHFDVQVENDELYFDYKLKPGICTSLNASILMRKIGIELVE